MALNLRQKRAYRHLCNIVRATVPVNATTGKPGDATYALIARNVPCLYENTPNVDDQIDAAGRIKRMTVFTTDQVHMEVSTDVRDQDLLVNVSKKADGSNSVLYATWHRAQGAPRQIENAGARRANKLSVMAMVVEKPPAGAVSVGLP